MKTVFGFRLCSLVLLMGLWIGTTASAPVDLNDARVSDALAPLQFISRGHVLAFTSNNIYVAGDAHALRVEFVNAAPIAPAADAAPDDSENVAPMSRVTYPNLWDGITLTYDAPAGTIVRSTYQIEAFGDVSNIRLRYNAPVRVESDGTLAIEFPSGAMRETAPVAWQERNGTRENVNAKFRIWGERQVGFALDAYDTTRPLVIDPTLTWHTFLGGTGTDEGFSIAADTVGNVYMTGWSNASWGSPVHAYSGGAYDGFVAKLDSTGNLLWNTFLGASAADRGYGIAVDSSGYVYVIGWSGSTWGSPIREFSGGEADAFIAKLDASGNLLWNTFLGGGGYDWGQHLTLDGNGNVFAIGHSFSAWGSPIRAHSNSRWDAYVAKLDSSGNLSWHTFLGGSMDDNGSSLFVDGNGNIFAAGYSANSWDTPVRAFSGGGDAFVAKLDDSGNLTWHSFVGGSGADSGYGITGDSSGNLYLSATSSADWGSPIRAYTGGDDALVAKLDSGGNLTWHTFLGSSAGDAASGIRFGNNSVWVIGWSDGGWGSPDRAYTAGKDTFAAKLTADGGLAWLTFLGGNGDDWSASDIAMDGSSNVYVGGYGPDWGSPLNGYAGGASDAFAVKLTKDVTQPQACPGNWRTFMGSIVGYDEARGVAIDADCNVYVVGYSDQSWGSPVNAHAGGWDAFAAKFNPNGALLWNTFMGSGNIDHGQDIAVDSNGNVYITGDSYENSWGDPVDPFAGAWEAFAVKLNSSGVRQWSTFIGVGGQWEMGYGIAVDGYGNVYVAGQALGSWGDPIDPFTRNQDAFIQKLDANGARVWNTYMGTIGSDIASDIEVDEDGNLYIVGRTWSGFVLKLNSDGTRAWTSYLGDEGFGVSVDGSGNVYVVGESNGSWGSPVSPLAGGMDGFAAKLDNSGTQLWNTFFGSATEDHAYELALDGSTNLFVVGSSDATWGAPLTAFAGPRDAFVIKLNNSGGRVWNTFIGSADDDMGNDVAVDASGGAFVAGYSTSRWSSMLRPNANENDGFISKLDATPTAITLASFSARAANNRVAVKWKTGSELQVIGFNVWRRDGKQSEFQKLNSALIPAQNPGGVPGGDYTYSDKDIPAGATLRYKLEVVKTNGGSEWSNVVKVNVTDACAGAPGTPTMTAPRDDATVKHTRVTLKWESVPCATTYRVIVRQGSPDGKQVDSAKGLAELQYKTIELKAGKTYYWHVRACSASGCSEWSQWQSFYAPKEANNKPE